MWIRNLKLKLYVVIQIKVEKKYKDKKIVKNIPFIFKKCRFAQNYTYNYVNRNNF